MEGVSPFFIVTDAQTSIAFYRDKLGFAVTYQQPDFATVRRDSAQLFVKAIGEDTPPLPNPLRHPWAKWDAYVSTSDPDALAAEFDSRGACFHAALADTSDGQRGFEISDPDGYVLFFGRPRLPGPRGRMETLDLHYSRFKLIRLALLALVGTAVGLWVATGGVEAGEERRGPGAVIGRLLGPDGVQMLGWAVVAATVAAAILYLRRAFADPVAARADAAGVTIRTMFATRAYAARDIERLELWHPAGQPILQVIPVAGRGKIRGLAVNGLAEREEEVEAWIGAVHAAHASTIGRARDDQGPVP